MLQQLPVFADFIRHVFFVHIAGDMVVDVRIGPCKVMVGRIVEYPRAYVL